MFVLPLISFISVLNKLI